ncbi:SDR family NAD(P)-dependent oxidoreductase [Nocardioides kribbensis]|uniref:SDR family NAD(P)-dependent oxidoreductase n=1 Tax=Nocardioides kribbensis TaxID=305517 RepID=A0ABV1P0U1_9ACTN
MHPTHDPSPGPSTEAPGRPSSASTGGLSGDHRAARPAVLVVGASSGIGLATARRLSARGARLVLAARDPAALDRTAAACRDAGAAATLVVPTDLTDPAQVEACVRAAVAAYGRLDAVVTTAQGMAYGTVEQVPREVFEHVVETAVHGTAHLVRATLPVFRAQGAGTLVVVSSLLAEVAVPSMSTYVTAKWGQLGLVRSLQLELRDEPGLHVCLVSPGAIDTPIYDEAATYAGSRGSAPPPVVGPDRVARAVERCLDHPRRRHVEVGPANLATILGFRLAPFVYDRVVGPAVRAVVLRGPAVGPDGGNVLEAAPGGHTERGVWTLLGRRRTREGSGARWRR